MDFFGMGLGEVLLIVIVALLIWGPDRIVEIARTLGKMVRSLRNITSDLTTAVTREIEITEKEGPSQTRNNSNDQTKESSAVSTAKADNIETSRPSH